MDAWKQYVMSIIVCSLGSGIFLKMFPDQRWKALCKLVCGMALAITVLKPLSETDLGLFLDFRWADFTDGQQLIAEGEMIAYEARRQGIKDACEAYILDKAELLGEQIAIEITLSEDLMPCFAEIRTESDLEMQEQLKQVLESDLGIAKENQRWTGSVGN